MNQFHIAVLLGSRRLDSSSTLTNTMAKLSHPNAWFPHLGVGWIVELFAAIGSVRFRTDGISTLGITSLNS